MELESTVLLILETSEWQHLTVKTNMETVSIEDRKTGVAIRLVHRQGPDRSGEHFMVLREA